MSVRLRVLAGLLVVSSGLFVSRTTAHAMGVKALDFGVIAPTTGTIKYATRGGPLVGVNIEVDNVTGGAGGSVGPVPQPRTCFACTLSFTSGLFFQTTPTSWEFNGGGSITLTGRVDLNGDGMDNDYATSVALMSGAFTPGTNSVQVFYLGGTFKIAGASFSDVKDPRLAALYGLPTLAQYNGNFNISFMASGAPTPGTNRQTFTSTSVLSGDILNHPISEPGSLLLLGSGLVGFVYLSRRRRKGV